MTHGGHETVIGSCGHVIRTCRCPGPKPERRLMTPCQRCGGTARDEEIRRHGAEIAKLAREIDRSAAAQIRERAERILALVPREPEPVCVTCGGPASLLWGRIETPDGDVYACSKDCAQAFLRKQGIEIPGAEA